MNIVFLIGNGFDLNIGMKTGYLDFYRFYLEQEPLKNVSRETIGRLKDSIRQNIEDWSDLEIRLGEYLNQKGEKEALDIHKDLLHYLQKYLEKEESRFLYNGEGQSIVRKDLLYPEAYLRPVDRQYIQNHYKPLNEDWRVRVISFNYTESLERLIPLEHDNLRVETVAGHNRYIAEIEHIHGYTKDRMVVGVNDVSQIQDQELRNSVRVLRRFVKPNCNRSYGLAHDEKCAEWIGAASIVCIYGMSLGDTDKVWWERISRHLLNGGVLIIFYYCKDQFHDTGGPDFEDRSDDVRDLFLSKTSLTEVEKQKIVSRIYICFSREIFSIKLRGI